MVDDNGKPKITGRCYCGATRIRAAALPTAVAYCHCSDCRRVTGAPVAAFAAFDITDVTFSPDEGRAIGVNPGVTRNFCTTCGSPLAGRYDYLPGTVYIALGLLDQADDIPPELHAHFGNKLTWLHIDDDLERHSSSARSRLSR
ncbi:MAG: GFA family protein [Geminicoccaceae bacterium]